MPQDGRGSAPNSLPLAILGVIIIIVGTVSRKCPTLLGLDLVLVVETIRAALFVLSILVYCPFHLEGIVQESDQDDPGFLALSR